MCQRMLNLMSTQINKKSMIFRIDDITFLFCFVCFCFVFAAANTAGCTVQCSRAASIGIAAGGSAAALRQLYYVYDDYDKRMNRIKELKSRLNLLGSSCKNKNFDADGFAEKAKVLNKHIKGK